MLGGNYDPQRNGPQPLFAAPALVVGLVAAIVLSYAALMVLPPEAQTRIVLSMAVVAARYSAALGLVAAPPEFADAHGALGLLAPLFGHVFVHATPLHLGFNALWLLVFGTPVARRMGAVRPFSGPGRFFAASSFLMFFFLGGAVAALVFVVLNPFVTTPLVGASGAISALMGAAARFVFRRPLLGDPYSAALAPIADRSVMGFTAAWVMINLLLAVSSSLVVGPGVTIAWEAHLGGYFFGLLAYPAFDRLTGAGRAAARPPIG